jgi:two-component system sensor histidine kinase YesM
MLTFLSLILLPIVTMTTVSFNNASANYEESITFSARQSFDQAYELITYRISSMIKSSTMVYSDTSIQNVLNREQSQTDIFEQTRDLVILDKFLYTVESSQGINRAKLYVPGWMMFATQGVNYGNLDEFMEEPEFKLLTENKRMMLFLKPELIKSINAPYRYDNTISMICAVKDMNKLSRVIGVIKIIILEDSVKEILGRTNAIHSAVTYIQNSAGDMISCSDSELLKSYDPNSEISQLQTDTPLSLEKVEVNGSQYLLSAKRLENTDWSLINVISYGDIFAKSIEIRNTLILITFVLGLFSAMFYYMLSRSIVRRIFLLNKSISEAQNGKLDMQVNEDGRDEIGLLIKNFNFMLYKIKALLDQQFALGQEVKNAEFKALQSQINPHFLYNTLELVNWKAIDNNVPEIVEIIQYMTKFYKISLSGGQDTIPLCRELEHVRMYVQIQNLRFENRIELISQIDENAADAKTLKLILQPLVENSILHGIFEKPERTGSITITGKIESNSLILTVFDNGVGMPERQAQQILDDQSPGYGVKNIDQRIKLRCGPEYGLAYESECGKGTKVTVRMSIL